jgi:hypothetical protein
MLLVKLESWAFDSRTLRRQPDKAVTRTATALDSGRAEVRVLVDCPQWP